ESGNLLASAWSSGIRVWDVDEEKQVSDFPIEPGWGPDPFLRFFANSSSVMVQNADQKQPLILSSSEPDSLNQLVCQRVAFNLSAEDLQRIGGFIPLLNSPSPTCPGLAMGHQSDDTSR